MVPLTSDFSAQISTRQVRVLAAIAYFTYWFYSVGK